MYVCMSHLKGVRLAGEGRATGWRVAGGEIGIEFRSEMREGKEDRPNKSLGEGGKVKKE